MMKLLLSEKLSFLLKLTDTSNKQLATALCVDPSLVSRMRQGRRTPPKNSAHTTAMAAYFAKKCTTEYQRVALAEMLGQRKIRLIMKSDKLAVILDDWLRNANPTETERIEKIVYDLNLPTSEEDAVAVASPASTKAELAHSRVYYGNSGRRSAVRAFSDYLMERRDPCTILLASDESIEWVTESQAFAKALSERIKQLAEAGFSFKFIAPNTMNIDEAIETFTRWIPIYMLNKLETYYYPRIRDNLFHRTILAVPGVISLSSSSVGFQVDSDITFLNFEPEIANATAREFGDYLEKCARMGVTHTHDSVGETVCECLHRYLELPSNKLSLYLGLPAPITPPSVLRRIFASNQEYIDIFRRFARCYDSGLSLYDRTDVIYLEKPEDIRNGRAQCVAATLVPGENESYYTPQEYADHLRAIIQLMKKHPNYFVATPENPPVRGTVWSCDGGECMIIRTQDPVTVLEISQPRVAAEASEYILHIAKAGGRTRAAERIQSMERIKELITALEKN